jgi:rRNA maturation endonuclease Nob1
MSNKIKKLKKAINDSIIENWRWYKVCEGCENVVDKIDAICPVCLAYRFDESRVRIVQQAEIISKKYCDFIDTNSKQSGCSD